MTYSPVYEHDLQSSVYVHMCMFDLSIFLESKRLLGIVFEEKYNINIAQVFWLKQVQLDLVLTSFSDVLRSVTME